MDQGLKYLGFHSKPNLSKKGDRQWLVVEVEKKINHWCNWWLSRGIKLVLVKVVLEAILVYWISLAWVPKRILEKIRKLCFKFILLVDNKKKGLMLASSKNLVAPKANGEWGLKKLFLFSMALARNFL
jgi:hypothetical protein